MRRLGGAALALAVSVLLVKGGAAAGFADGTRYVFVAAQNSPAVAVIDSRDDRVAGTLDMGLVPSQLEPAGDGARLVAVDGVAARVLVMSAETGQGTSVALDFVPTRLVVAGDGRRAVAGAPELGRLAVVDVAGGKVVTQTTMPALRDMTVAGERVVLAPRDGEHLTLLELATLRPVAEVAAPRPGLGGFGALARSPTSRLVYARAVSEPVVLAVDVLAGKITGEVPTGAPRAYTNATGITLILPEGGGEGLALVPSSLRGGTRLRGEAGITGVYSGWFDTVSFLPSAHSRSVAVIDQQGRFRGDDIILGAVPGRGTVTPDGRKLYLPLTDTNRVAVIDAERRVLAGYIALPHKPLVAVMARTFGLCH